MIKNISLIILLSISVNASEIWSVRSVHDGLVNNIFFIDDMTGWACANFPGILKTENGGNTWEKIYFGGNGTIYTIWFVTKDKGWAAGAHVEGGDYGDSKIKVRPAIFVTNDGGKSWHLQKLIENSGNFVSLYFSDEKHGWVAGGINNRPNGILLYTSDGGENWMELDSPAMKHDDGSDDNVLIRDIYFSDTQQGWAIGTDIPKNKIFHTTTGGKSWSLQSTINTGADLSNIYFTDSKNGWLIGGLRDFHDSVLKTTDGGDTWNKVSMPLEENDLWLSDVVFIDKIHGWICGGKGTLYMTKDGGNSWVKESLPTEEDIIAIAATKSKIFVGGLNGNIYSKPLSFKVK